MMRHALDDGARRPRRMQEETDRLLDAEIAQFGAERQEMIILNPERRLRFLEPQQRPRHEGIDFTIGEIVVLRGADQIGAGVQRRPQRRIRKTFIVAAVMRGRQIEHCQRTGAKRLNFREWFLLCTIAHTAAGTHPNRAGFFDHRQ